jgi:hypothetical protein
VPCVKSTSQLQVSNVNVGMVDMAENTTIALSAGS